MRYMNAYVGNTIYRLDNSNTFGGTHFTDPRMIGIQVRCKFHY